MPSCACCKDIEAANSARPFKNPAPVLDKSAVLDLLGPGSRSIIEYGAGNLRNAHHLLGRGHRVAVVEIDSTIDRFRKKYQRFSRRGGSVVSWGKPETFRVLRTKFDLALITFVLETICNPRERTTLLRHCRKMLRSNGSLVLSIRGHRDVVAAGVSGQSCSDGYRTSGRTFIRGFDIKQVVDMLEQSGFTQVTPLHQRNLINPELIHVLAK